jgi:serine/threonine-protein kinase
MHTSAPHSRSELLQRLLADQSERWQRGEFIRVESYLVLYPDLADDAETLLDLLHAEVLWRQERGDTPHLDEYLARFPRHADGIRRRWAVHGFLAGQALPDDSAATGSELLTQPLTAGRRPIPLPVLPGYEILEELGKGGMGVVYKARQRPFGRLVALKMVRAHLLAGPDEVARFRTEAQAVGRLDHPHVVHVFAFGEEQGCPYFAMEYLSGGSLARLLRQGPLEPRHAAELVRQVARGVQAAHEAGILHRDLKPGNVLLDSQGNARVADFGLAKLLDDPAQTASEVMLGTPAYMAPEQADGKTREIGPATDVWALGVVLYEALTGRTPFRASSRVETLQRVKHEPPPPPRHWRREVPAALEAVCLKALQKDPRQRYGSAAALADDLERWLQGRAVTARAAGWLTRGTRFLAAHRRVLLAVLLPLLLLAPLLLRLRRPDADQPRKDAEAALAAGKPWVFEGVEPLPGPFRWVVGRAALEPDADEGCFSFQYMSTGLLELVADPGSDRYLFSAEVRHDDAAGNAHLGLYFGDRQHLTGEGLRQRGFFTLSFADRGDLAHAPRGGGKVSSQVSLQYSGLEQRKEEDWVRGRNIGPGRLFEASPRKPRQKAPWRQLAVRVTPEAVEALWRDERGRLDSFTRITAGNMDRATRRLLQMYPSLAGIPTGLRPRSALGLFVFRSEGSFRHVKVQPLREDGRASRR